MVDEDSARELQLFIENDGTLYRQQYEPILKNLARKKYRSIYDHDKAVKLFGYLTAEGARRYNQEVMGKKGIPGYFGVAERRAVAENLTKDFEGEFELGNYSQYEQKYLQKPHYKQEFMEYYKGDSSVGIPRATAEQTRNELLKDAKTSEDKRLINEIYREVKQQEQKEDKYWRQEYKQWKKEQKEEKYRKQNKKESFHKRHARWVKQGRKPRKLPSMFTKEGEPLKSNRGQGGYFRHRPEHSINRRKAYARKGR